ncbi:3-dehydroquinate synthase [Flavobacteriaceae bacterium]|nr:3-dehydroquinate synthase [Flavobacteriaceae bacterium]MDC1491892.1 3-dehydroquinate synthase [Flavobacteriaceae bacterium]
MDTIIINNYALHFNNTAYEKLNTFIDEKNFSKIIVITDTNTKLLCLDEFYSKFHKEKVKDIINISFFSGEKNKNLSTCKDVWNSLSEYEVDRSSLIINLGGGVVTDLGGFIASTFMRGIEFINVPTTLLAMVDASIGGKTGVDLNNIKNQIGVINNPSMVIIDSVFLKTLPADEMKSGFSEMIKHSLITGATYWESIKSTNINSFYAGNCFYNSILIKSKIVSDDPYEKGLRKVLNYGHTVGHAIETFCMSTKNRKDLTHGHSIALGMIIEGYLSTIKLNFDGKLNLEINQFILNNFENIKFKENEVEEIIKLMRFDKKKSGDQINFVLLKNIGEPIINQKVEIRLIKESFKYLENIN